MQRALAVGLLALIVAGCAAAPPSLQPTSTSQPTDGQPTATAPAGQSSEPGPTGARPPTGFRSNAMRYRTWTRI
jgi:hypothetical protein